jgi:glycosyltransferase involved in cell wall biosynthesis
MNAKKIELVHVVESLGGGGLERRMLECVKGLSRDARYSQHVILLYDKIDYLDIYNTNAELVVLKNKSKIKRGIELINQLHRIKPDIVHLWTGSLMTIPIYFRKISFGYKIIAGFIADGNVVNSPIYRVAMNFSFHKADLIVGNSRAGIIAKKAPSNKSVVVYNGFSFDRFKNFPTYEKSSIKAEFGINTEFVISMNARFYPAKDWDTYLEIAKKIGETRNDVTFLAVGKGELLQHYINKAANLGIGNVIFTGFRKDVDRVYFISDICVLCTNEKVHAEGVSNSIMEAMAAGKPVIATYGGGTPEIIEDGRNGIIIQPHDSYAGTDAIKKLLSDMMYRSSLGNSARETVERKFSLSGMVEEYKKIYSTLISS